MYLASVGPPRTLLRRVPGNVVALGIVSLVTDVSAEMVTAVLPLYLVFGLGLNPLQFGLLDGLYAGATAVLRLVGGHVADRWRRLKTVAGVGYALSAISKLGFLAAGSTVPAIGAVLAIDRAGKGIRTAPRDALISLSSDPATMGRSFGVHRALDTIGAFLGPLVATLVLWASLNDYNSVFVTSFALAACGVILLTTVVQNHTPSSTLVVRASAVGLLKDSGFRRCCVWAAGLGLFTITDSFVYLAVQRRWDISTSLFPLLPLGTAGTFLLLAIPLGRLGDRVGRWKVFIGGHLALVVALLVVCGPVGAWWLVLALHGVFYAATDGVLPAAVGPLLPEDLRATGLAVLQTGQALARMAAAVTVGLLWTLWDLRPALLAFTLALLAVTIAAAVFKPLEVRR
ncbi:MFS transporter [Kribbella speibonae]|uniref:MFS transporter n=1 Tax=Kribbella speibonae TaxID=1572660 RepID=A0A4R0ISF8_9ACTN|nr:MFS transporter [Kribbella speibonae]TCC27060.1 MFS transporter [Kribbella speibonae]TCC36089.1 MFS transporter [Kribbella speibonae]